MPLFQPEVNFLQLFSFFFLFNWSNFLKIVSEFLVCFFFHRQPESIDRRGKLMWFKMETLYFSSLMFLGVGRSEMYIFTWSLNYF
jgi:hypothetical protein